MKSSFSERSLILIFCLVFALSSAFLFWKNGRELDPDLGKNWWTLSFADPQNPKSLTFIITNHTKESAFTYEVGYTVTPDKVVTSKNSLMIAPGDTQTVIPELSPQPHVRTSVIVTLGKEKKEIYR